MQWRKSQSKITSPKVESANFWQPFFQSPALAKLFERNLPQRFPISLQSPQRRYTKNRENQIDTPRKLSSPMRRCLVPSVPMSSHNRFDKRAFLEGFDAFRGFFGGGV